MPPLSFEKPISEGFKGNCGKQQLSHIQLHLSELQGFMFGSSWGPDCR